MADIVDHANDLAQLEIDAIVANRPRPVIRHGHGECLACGEKIEGDGRWCDAECRDGWEKKIKPRT